MSPNGKMAGGIFARTMFRTRRNLHRLRPRVSLPGDSVRETKRHGEREG